MYKLIKLLHHQICITLAIIDSIASGPVLLFGFTYIRSIQKINSFSNITTLDLNASIDKLNNQGKELDDKGTAITNQVLGEAYYNRAISRWYINDLTGACDDAKKSESLGVRFSEMIEDACN